MTPHDEALIPPAARRHATLALPLLAGALICAASCTSDPSPQPPQPQSPAQQSAAATPAQEPATAAPGAIARARFDAQGRAMIPADWRRWVYVGTPLTPNGLNKGKAPFPEFHNVYVEPSAFDSYMQTGTWAQGTQIVKELVLVRSSDNAPDGSSIESSGRGYFQGEFQGLELLVKDSQRFAKEPGGWAFFSFGHKPEPYDPTAAILPASACSGCHEGSADTDFVFTQYYPMLRARAARAGR
jgi:Cytochrome P460